MIRIKNCLIRNDQIYNVIVTAAANTGDLEQFVKALEKSASSNTKNTEKKEKSDESKQDTPMEEDKNA